MPSFFYAAFQNPEKRDICVCAAYRDFRLLDGNSLRPGSLTHKGVSVYGADIGSVSGHFCDRFRDGDEFVISHVVVNGNAALIGYGLIIHQAFRVNSSCDAVNATVYGSPMMSFPMPNGLPKTIFI